MTAHIAISHHAAQRITERLVPVLGAGAEALVVEEVLDAVWNARFIRRAPRWLEYADKRRGDDVRYVSRRAGGLRFVIIVNIDDPALPRVITVIAERTGPPALAALPVLADGRVIGRLRTTPLPVAFQTVAA